MTVEAVTKLLIGILLLIPLAVFLIYIALKLLHSRRVIEYSPDPFDIAFGTVIGFIVSVAAIAGIALLAGVQLGCPQ